MTTITKRLSAVPSGTATKRITSAITASATRRVPEEVLGHGPFLLLEGDSSGALRLEGDDVGGYLRLQGTY